jgi:hypothetical protein
MKYSYLKDETGGYILQEDGDKLIIGEKSSSNFFLMYE